MTTKNQVWLGVLLAWLGLVLSAFWGHDYIPIDETRYISVAWEMWLKGNQWVPHLNGETYSHKPPLLFWLIQLGWAAWGVNDWWPRVVPAIFSLGVFWLTAKLARQLFPDQPQLAWQAPLVLLASQLWSWYMPGVMFDIILAFFALWAASSALEAFMLNSRPFSLPWVKVGLALGLGILTKGPVILLDVMFLILLAPWWAGQALRQRARAWYGGFAFALVIGIGIGLCWAIPAAIKGGEAYAEQIFWGQTAHRVVDSFAHRRAWWWYLPLLPLLLFPYFIWPPVWRGLTLARGHSQALPWRFLIAWIAPVFVALMAVSGKQVHYLLPIFPAWALLVVRGLSLNPVIPRWSQWPVVLMLLVFALVLLAMPYVPSLHGGFTPLEQLPAMIGGGVLLLAIWTALPARWTRIEPLYQLAACSLLLTLWLSTTLVPRLAGYYDMRPMAACLKTLQEQDVPVAYVGKYHGQFQFAGRLRLPLETLSGPGELETWHRTHPDGVVVIIGDQEMGEKVCSFPFRSRQATAWRLP